MDWLHCNTCYYQPGDGEKRGIYLTDCGHLYCKTCLNIDKNNLSDVCSVCNKQYAITPVNSEMQDELKEYFMDPRAQLSKLIQTLKFQNGHRLRLFEHNTQQKTIHSQYEDFCQKAKKEVEKLTEKLQQVEEENKKLKLKYFAIYNTGDIQQTFPAKRKPPFEFSPAESVQFPYKGVQSPFGTESSPFSQTPGSQTIWADRITLSAHRKTPSSAVSASNRSNG